MSTTPKLVAQNRNTTAAAEDTAGNNAGRVTVENARQRDAPRDRAASSTRGSSCDHSPPTVRATTAMLKKALATTMLSTPPSGHSARNASPTTTVGSTNGTRTNVRTTVMPGSRTRANRNASGNPASTATTVAASACATVNPASRHVDASTRVSTTPPSATPNRMIAATGQAKNNPRKAKGRTPSAAAAQREPERERAVSPRVARAIPR